MNNGLFSTLAALLNPVRTIIIGGRIFVVRCNKSNNEEHAPNYAVAAKATHTQKSSIPSVFSR